LVQAEAYDAEPTRPGVVRAVEALYAPIPVVAPIVIGWLASELGLVYALSALLLQPVGIGLIAGFAAVRRDAGEPRHRH
jgi:hypothetical protein